MANNFMHFDTSAKGSPVTSEKHAVMLSILIKKHKNRSQDFQKKIIFFCILVTQFSVNIKTLLVNFHMECTELQSNIQLNGKIVCVSLPDFHNLDLTREKYPSLHSHALFMSSLFGSTYICEQLLSRMKHRKSNTS